MGDTSKPQTLCVVASSPAMECRTHGSDRSKENRSPRNCKEDERLIEAEEEEETPPGG